MTNGERCMDENKYFHGARDSKRVFIFFCKNIYSFISDEDYVKNCRVHLCRSGVINFHSYLSLLESYIVYNSSVCYYHYKLVTVSWLPFALFDYSSTSLHIDIWRIKIVSVCKMSNSNSHTCLYKGNIRCN